MLRQQCARFVADHAEAIAQLKPPMPESLNDRAADIWEPLLVLILPCSSMTLRLPAR